MAKRPPSFKVKPSSQPVRSWVSSRRGSRHERGYGAAWDKLRAAVLRDEPLCRLCRDKGQTVIASDVDHITAKFKGGTDARDNLQPLCRACHTEKTQREAAEAKRRRA